MRLLFGFDAEKCTACGACAIACMDQNDIDVEAGQRPYRRVLIRETQAGRRYLSLACLHCADAPCILACPANCLYRDDKTGLVRYDNTACVGCRACQRACPHDALSFRPTGAQRPREKMEKCHGCLERVEAGLSPACVRACPTGALTWRWAEDSETPAAFAHQGADCHT